jgi:PAS domain S-box-containing protein
MVRIDVLPRISMAREDARPASSGTTQETPEAQAAAGLRRDDTPPTDRRDADLIERWQAEGALRERERFLDGILGSISDAFHTVDAQWRFTFINDAGAAAVGLASAADAIGKTVWDLLPYAVDSDAYVRLHRAMTERVTTDYERHDPQRQRWYHGTAYPMADGGLAVFVRDITAERLAETQARESQERYRSLFDHMLDGVAYCRMLYDEHGRAEDFVYLAVNDAFGRLTGLADVIGRRVTDVIPRIKELTPELFEIYGRVACTGHSERFEIDFTPLGKQLAVAVYCPAAGHFVAVFDDITSRKQAEADLRRKQAELQVLFDNTPAGLVLFDASPPYTVLAHNRYYQELFAEPYRSQGMLGLSIRDYAPAVEASGVVAVVDEVVRTARPKSLLDFPYRSNPPHESWFNWYLLPLILDGQVIALVSMSLDVTERHLVEAALAESDARERARAQELQAVLDAVPAAVWIAHDPRALKITGNRLSSDWVRLPEGGNPSQSLPEGERATTFRMVKDGVELPPPQMPVQMAAAGAEIRDYEFEFVYPDGNLRHVLGNASPLRDERGQPRGAISAFVDITARKKAEEALREANAALAEADRRKDEFIAVLSHELRNPLAPIRYALPILATQALDDAGGRAVSVVSRQVDQLVRLVDDLLDVSRITRGKIELRPEPVTVGAIVSAAIEAASPDIAAARHSLEVVVPDEPIWVRADRARLAQVVTNLLNNAAKYTPRGGRIYVEASHEDGSAIVRVRDNGVGIPPEALPTIFEMFRQVNRPESSQGGLGIGLGLVRQLVEMHDGTVEARSAGPGEGTEVVVRLPVADPAGAPESAEAVADATTGRSRLKVLVVDDNADLAEVLAMVVEGLGHNVRKAFDGRTAISAATAYRPDVVLLDLGLPVMSGIDVARQLRQQPETAHALLVALTGWGQAEDRARTREAGFDHHLTKPADPSAIADLLSRCAAPRP